MECIKYINDLEIEIRMLEDLKGNIDCDEKEIEEKINRKRGILERCKENLSKLSDNQICYRIYLNILNGMSVSKAIEKVAEENVYNDVKPFSAEALWKCYYPQLKKILKK